MSETEDQGPPDSGIVSTNPPLRDQVRSLVRALADAGALRGLVAVVLAVPLALVALAGATRLSPVAAVEALSPSTVLRGAIAMITAVSKRRERDPVPAIAGGSIAIMAGVLAGVMPASLTDAAIVTAAAGSVLVEAMLVAWSMRRDRETTGKGDGALDPATASIPDVLWDWVVGSDIGRRERAAQAEGLYFENPGRLTKLGTWWVMLVLSVAIATFAVLGDSIAVVIGAMPVAPLMTPLMGLAGAIVNGWQRRAGVVRRRR